MGSNLNWNSSDVVGWWEKHTFTRIARVVGETSHADLLRDLNLTCERFEFCPEVTAKVLRKGINIVEVPISYYPRTISEGKKISWWDGFEAVWTLVKYRFL